MEVFDLSQLQSEYILELRLRRLTKFSRIELEAERDQLRAEIAALEELLASEPAHPGPGRRGARPGRRALRHATSHPAHRGARACPSAQGGRPRHARDADMPCRVILSATGRIARIDAPEGETAVVSHPRAAAQARRGPVRARHHEPHRDRRAHLEGPRHPVLATRPARAAAELCAARGRRARRGLPRAARPRRARPRRGLARVVEAHRARHRAGRRQARSPGGLPEPARLRSVRA